MKKLAALIENEECHLETYCPKTVTLIKKVKDCKPFVLQVFHFFVFQ